jgi:hypothetical protein
MKHTTPNSLIHETSPYLLQHAYNPVQWQPWGTQALEEARTTNRMLLVSIGYSSCHWCHVMEHESFEDAEVAALMNRHFVCIKVDREERPDVDQVFMDAVHLLGQRGGWPLNCVALPDGRPVWGGTYFRRDQWMGILMQLADLYEKQSPELFEQAEQLSQALINNRFVNNDTFKNVLSDALPVKMAESIAARLDPVHGGSRGAPKFPMPDNLLFLLLIAHKEGNNEMMQNVRHSLLQMASGGIYDQLAGGFSRYSVDELWHVPHFEKMLYDNAQLINLYATAYPLMKEARFEEVCRETITFLIADMLGPEGGFYAALDADSEGVEGKFYVWRSDEFKELLGNEAGIIGTFFGMDSEALWEHDLNVLVRRRSIADFCHRNGLNKAQFGQTLQQARSTLLSARAKRIPPALDDKRLASWNALMISALCRAYAVFGEEAWLRQAKSTAGFVMTIMKDNDGNLIRSWKNGSGSIPAFLDDYALLANALISLFEVSGDESMLHHARNLVTTAMQRFGTDGQHIFNYAPTGQQELIANPVEVYDNVVPSSNASMCMALIRLGMLFHDSVMTDRAEKMLAHVAGLMESYPGGFSHWAQALMLLRTQGLMVIRGEGALQALKDALPLVPPFLMIAATEGLTTIPALSNKGTGSKLQFWYCDTQGCRLPKTGFAESMEDAGL